MATTKHTHHPPEDPVVAPPYQRMIVFDPGCREAFGHHPALDQLLVSYCHTQAMASRVLVAQGCANEVVRRLKAEPVLTPGIYMRIPDSPAETIAQAHAINAAIYSELTSTLAGDLGDGDVFVVHTVSPWTFPALYRLAETVEGRGVAFRLVFRFPPAFAPIPKRLTTSNLSPLCEVDAVNFAVLETIYAQVFPLWRQLDLDVKFLADTYELARDFEKIGAGPMDIVPIQIDFSAFDPEHERPAERDAPVFLFAGNGRKEKGIRLLPEAIERYLASGRPGRFLIQSINFATRDVAERLEKMHPHVEIMGESLSGRAYFDFLARGDAVLVPYDPASYRLRTSHIFIEALGLGRPVITTKDTWMEEELERLGQGRRAGVIMEAYTSAALAKAMMRFYDERQRLAREARAMAKHVRARHNADEFIRVLLS